MSNLDLFKIAEVELVYKRPADHNHRPLLKSSEEAYHVFRDNWDDMTINLIEEFKILMTDASTRCLCIANISKGGIDDAQVDQRIIFATALKARATGIIVGHNHPSGVLRPSQMDNLLTRQIHQNGKLLRIKLLDHLIISDDGYYSMLDKGVMPS